MCHIHLRDGGRGPPATVPVAALTAGTKAIYWLRIAISAYPPAFDAPLGGFQSEYRYPARLVRKN